MNTNFLRIPLYKLNYIDDLPSFSGLTGDELKSFDNEYDETEKVDIKAAVKWATENESFDFLSLVPDLKYTNKDIYEFLCKINNSFNAN